LDEASYASAVALFPLLAARLLASLSAQRCFLSPLQSTREPTVFVTSGTLRVKMFELSYTLRPMATYGLPLRKKSLSPYLQRLSKVIPSPSVYVTCEE
jgi:hypothetical protein